MGGTRCLFDASSLMRGHGVSVLRFTCASELDVQRGLARQYLPKVAYSVPRLRLHNTAKEMIRQLCHRARYIISERP
jgi:hypothetical protein